MSHLLVAFFLSALLAVFALALALGLPTDPASAPPGPREGAADL